MKYSLLISFFLHLSVALFFFGKASGDLTRTQEYVPQVELLSAIKTQRARHEKKQGAKAKAKNSFVKITKNSLKKSGKDKLGNARENQGELKSIGKAFTRERVKTYGQELQSYIEKNRYYPKKAIHLEQTGIVKVRLVISAQGLFEKIEIVKPSQFDGLNKSAKKSLVRLKSFKPLPKELGDSWVFIVPIEYR